MGSNVSQYEIDWLYRSRRIPEGVTCRLPGDEIEPVLEPGERVVFLAHFERDFGLPVSAFFRSFLDFYKLQPHHLPGNAVFYLSCYATFMEAYIGIRPTRETFARFFALRINSVQGTFFYVRNNGAADLIDLPPFDPAPPTRANWGYNPKDSHNETNRIIRFMKQRMKDTNICSDDIVRTFISRRVLPLQRRAHKMSEMYGPGDPTKITGLPLSKKDVAKDRFPGIDSDRRGPCRKRGLDKFDPDPVIRWQDLKMGRTPASRLGRSPPEPSDVPSANINPQVHEHVAPLQAEAGQEFVDKLMAQGKKNKAPADAGSSQAPASKRFRTEPFAGLCRIRKDLNSSSSRKPGTFWCRHYLCLPSGRHHKFGRAAPTPPDHRAEEDLVSPPETHDAGASNIGAGKETAGRAEPLVPPVLEKKKKKTKMSSPSKAAPEPFASESSNPGDAPDAPPSPRTTPTPPPGAPHAEPAGATLTASPPKTLTLVKGKETAPSASSGGQQPLALHVSRAASAAGEKATGLLGRITKFQREGRELGPLLPYAEKWNAADLSKATRGLGKDRLPVPDPAGERSSEEHFMRLRRAVKELDSAWFDATNNLMSTADARKVLFEELLWEHRDLAEAHSKCQAIPEASLEALRTQLAAAKEEKDKLVRQHQEELDAQKTSYQKLKEQLIQLSLEHAKALETAESAAEARLNEALEDAGNANVVLQAELEEAAKARKAAEDKAARLDAEQKEYDLLVTQTDALALRLFPDSQTYAVKKVGERRVLQAHKNLGAPWDPYDHLVALNARVSHMRCVDRNLSDIPDVASQLYRTLWPGEQVPHTFSLISDRLKGAGRRIREWQCSAARAGADSALRVACSWYPELDLDALTGVREGAETDLDPVLTAKRQDRAYHIAEYADMRTFIPPPEDVKDYLSDEEEGEDADDAPPEGPDAQDAPPEAPVA
ncbi:hypothetical protein QYE76_031493 [Lolium multiflorum]|uniref:Transposase (putative) gypsy type domain-containing protein n=1 Tax=Lolium multiflorum TaxID=4521 RepID=A0AAD8VK89_LOLMU|nr:hypothetical protein QYE76_031493 [Lolium multiflorum]